MSLAKRDNTHSAQRWSKPQRSPASCRERAYWVARWIGAAMRRAVKPTREITTEAPSARIIQLSWADTFGRPAGIAVTGLFQPRGTIVRLLPH